MKKLSKRFLLSLQISMLVAATGWAQGQTFTDEAEFDSTICGTVFESDFGSILIDTADGAVPLNEFADQGALLAPLDLTTSWGEINTTGFSNNVVSASTVDGEVVAGYLWGDDFTNGSNTWNIAPSLGPIEGFSICYNSSDDIELQLFDGPNLVETVTIPATDQLSTELNFFGWVNTTGVTFDSVAVGEPDIAFFCEVNFWSTADDCDPEATDCQSLLVFIVEDLQSLLPTGDEWDDARIEAAIHNFTVMQDPIFFRDSDLLSVYGCTFFQGAYYSTNFLENVDTIDVTQNLLDIQDLLACLTAAEIQEATDRGGDQAFIDFAQECEDFAQYMEDIGCFHAAVYWRKYAWVYAYLA